MLFKEVLDFFVDEEVGDDILRNLGRFGCGRYSFYCFVVCCEYVVVEFWIWFLVGENL